MPTPGPRFFPEGSSSPRPGICRFVMMGRKRLPPDKPEVPAASTATAPKQKSVTDQRQRAEPSSPQLSKPLAASTETKPSRNMSCDDAVSAASNPKVVMRPDIVARMEQNKGLDFFTIKKTLRAFTTSDGQGLAWTECIKEVNQAVAEGYLLAYYYVLLQVTNGRPVLKLNKGFYRTCLTLVTNTTYRASDTDLNTAATAFNDMRGLRPRANTQYLNQGWFMAAAIEMATNAQNLFVKNFAKRLRTYVLEFYGLSREDAAEVVQKVFEVREDEQDDVQDDGDSHHIGDDQVDDYRQQADELTNYDVLEYIAIDLRSKIPRKQSGKISWEPHNLVGIYYEFLSYIDQWNDDHREDPDFTEKRAFPLLPTKRGFVCSHRKVDTTGLYGLLRRSPTVRRDLVIEHDGVLWTLEQSLKRMTTWMQLADKWWRKLFCIDDIERACGGHFHQSITTDGYSVSILMDRPTRGSKNQSKKVSARMAANEQKKPSKQESTERHKSSEHPKKIWRRKEPDPNQHSKKKRKTSTVETKSRKRKAAKSPKRKHKKHRASKAFSTALNNTEEPISDALGFPLPTMPKGTANEYDIVWGIDPGRTDFVMAVNQHNEALRFRTSCFHRASGYNRSNRKTRHRIDKQPDFRQLLKDTPTKKTSSPATLAVAIQYWFNHGPELLMKFMDPTFFFRKLAFRRFSLRTAQLERACHEIAGPPGTKTIVGFGDSGTHGAGFIKRSVAGPVKEFARRLSRYCEVVVIDEYRTSKVHYDCESTEDLKNQRVKRVCRDGRERLVPVHKVLHCLKKRGELDGCGASVDRDVNAAKNIRGILQYKLEGLQRPERLCRSQ